MAIDKCHLIFDKRQKSNILEDFFLHREADTLFLVSTPILDPDFIVVLLPGFSQMPVSKDSSRIFVSRTR
jgi:hypothetical protein